MRKLIFPPILFFLCFCSPYYLLGQALQEDSTTTIFQFLMEKEIIHLTVETNVDSLLENRKMNKEQKAKLSLHFHKDSVKTLTVKIRPRGVFRRKYCDIPPLRLNFDKEDLSQLKLNRHFDKYKLVTHCVNDVSGDQTLAREYWTYRMYNEMTSNSFKVHLVKIKYINTASPENVEERIGFIIENNKELTERLGGELIEPYGLKTSDINRTTYENTTVFNYMIGNLDWKLKSQRNLKFIKHPEKGILVIPYDFDMSAMVWPAYARLNPDYGQERFEDRFCLGSFESKESLNNTLKNFLKVKDINKNHIKKCPILNSISKRNILSYLSSFYYIISKEKRIKKAFYENIEGT